MKVIMFGASKIAYEYCKLIKNDPVILAFADNRYKEIEGVNGHSVISPDSIKDYSYDKVIIALDDLKPGNEENIISIYNQLLDMGISDDKIVLQSFKYQMEHSQHKPRTVFIRNLSEYFRDNGIKGAVAECGVYRGWFSGIISRYFYDSKLYLFDTFCGFDTRDVEKESAVAKKWLIEDGGHERLKNTSENMVKLRCENRQQLTIKKGYIPETFNEVSDKFCFVNLDMDLYAPQLAALDFFSTKMVTGGVILLHDYFNKALPGTKKAVKEFCQGKRIKQLPIGDELSIALLMND